MTRFLCMRDLLIIFDWASDFDWVINIAPECEILLIDLIKF